MTWIKSIADFFGCSEPFIADEKSLLLDGLSRLNNGDYNGAIDPLRKANAINPRNPETIFTVGLCLYSMERHTEAIVEFRKILPLETNDEMRAQALFHSAICCHYLKKFVDARVLMWMAINIVPDFSRGEEVRRYLRDSQSWLSDEDKLLEEKTFKEIANKKAFSRNGRP